MGFLANSSKHYGELSRVGRLLLGAAEMVEQVLSRVGEHAGLLQVVLVSAIALVAFGTRLFSVIRYESVIHEFDPWFNFRATKYLVDNGWHAFLDWFDERAWYPLGRVVGVTVYPGIMVTSAALHYVANDLLCLGIDIRDICVFLAPLFAGLTVVATFLLTREIQEDGGAALLAAAFVAICPGYISRSVAGSYDNECIAIFLMVATFYLWVRSVKTGSVVFASAAAMMYFYMVSAWGGYVFITNLIPLHVFVLLLMGRYSTRLYTAYCTFYVLGTLASMTIVFVDLRPAYSTEHLAAMGVFGLLQIMAFIGSVRSLVEDRHFQHLKKAFAVAIFALCLAAILGLTVCGHIGPLTGRFYSLWDTSYARKHTPIIASVSEHQPTTWSSLFLDLHMLLFTAPAGLYFCIKDCRDEHIFAIMYILTAAYFAGVMVRLVLVLAPIMCILGAIAINRLFDIYTPGAPASHIYTEGAAVQDVARKRNDSAPTAPLLSTDTRVAVILPALAIIALYIWHCTWTTSAAYSSPSIMLSSNDPRTGEIRIIDDFREAYYWLRRNTDVEAKVLAWWDYGYQISGMADRTTIVDNNTWNNTHIATVGLALALPEDRAYKVLRQLDVNYVLILSGVASGYSGDDMNKFLWMVRIASGVFPAEVQERDYLTERGEYRMDAHASKAMRESLLYKMTYYGVLSMMGPQSVDRARRMPLNGVDPKLHVLEEAYSTDSQIVRIFKVKDPDALGRSLFSDRK